MRGVEGVVDLQIEKQVLIPQIKVGLKRDEAKKYGIKIGELAELLETALNGRVVSEVLDGQRTFDILVRFDEDHRNSLEAIRAALIDTPVGAKIPLSTVADVFESKGPNVIGHENIQRRIVVSCNTSGRDLGSIIEEMQKKIAGQVKLPVGCFITYGGQFESQQQATRMIGILGVFSLLGMALALFMHFRSANLVGLILLNIPFALVGAVLAIWLTTRTFSIGSMVGFVTLAGISARNGIMMISHYLHLLREEGEAWTPAMILRGAQERLVPVLMTALTAALALVPPILSPDDPGTEILYPVDVVIFGGLIRSPLINIVLLPTLFWNYGRAAAERLIAKPDTDESSPVISRRDP
jgi:HME family heavy-metal exporter